MKYFKEQGEIRHGADTKTIALEFQGKIVLGKFVDRERPTYLDTMNEYYSRHLGETYIPYTG
jgi:2-oxoglutarate ferredoxin oxidoreductase subunit beta